MLVSLDDNEEGTDKWEILIGADAVPVVAGRGVEQVGPHLKEKGLLFVGLDVIGDYLTEINVTSPTCIREIDAGYDLDIGGALMDCINAELKSRGRA